MFVINVVQTLAESTTRSGFGLTALMLSLLAMMIDVYVRLGWMQKSVYRNMRF